MSAMPIVPTADLVAELRAMHSIPCLTAADRLEEMAREIKRLMVIATDTQLEAEIQRAVDFIPSVMLHNGEPWEQGVMRLRRTWDAINDDGFLEMQAADSESLMRKVVNYLRQIGIAP